MTAVNSFLCNLINSKLISYARKIQFIPKTILTFNISEIAYTELRLSFSDSQIKNIFLDNDRPSLDIITHHSIDLIIANFSGTNETEIWSELNSAKRWLKKDGLFIFAAIDHVCKSLLPPETKPNQDSVDDMQIIQRLKSLGGFDFVQTNELIMKTETAHDEIRCYYFFVKSQQATSSIKTAIKLPETSALD